MRDKSSSLVETLEFSQAFHSSPIAIHNFLCDIFLHNLAVLDNREHNPLLCIGDIQLRSLISWIKNKINRDVHAKSYRELEEEIPLYLRPKDRDPKTCYYDWLKNLSIRYNKPCNLSL